MIDTPSSRSPGGFPAVETALTEQHPYATGIRGLFAAALAVFVVTVAIGILNGTDLVNFDRQTLMGHVHSGTLGWISLSVFAAALWLFGTPGPHGWSARIATVLPPAAVLAITGYVIAFFATSGIGRPLMGTVALFVMVAFLVWVTAQARVVVLSVPRLGVLAALATLASGAVLGVLLGLELAGSIDVLPDGAYDAHPATMVVGFLIPMGMALADWRLAPELVEVPADRAGRAQIAAPFLGGVLLMVGALFDLTALVALSLPLEITGIVLLIRRLRGPIGRVDWAAGRRQRGSVFTVVFLVADIALLAYLIARYQGEIDDAPQRMILALDHLMFIGVMTNSLFALIDTAARNRRWVRADGVVLWGMNAGLVVFALGLLADVTVLKRVGAPVMGTAILVGIATVATRLGRQTLEQ